MQKTPVRGTHTRARGLWPNKLRIEPRLNGELAETRVQLKQLMIAALEKTGQINALLREKDREQALIDREMSAAFRKPAAPARRKAVARAKTQLENHLHRTILELDLKKAELKKIYHKVNSIKQHLRKGQPG